MASNYDENEVRHWDGIFKDGDACGVDDGYPPGTEGAKVWEKLNPGRKVVDWLGRDENHPAYRPTGMDADDAESKEAAIAEYKAGVDALNQEIRAKGLSRGDVFKYGESNPIDGASVDLENGTNYCDRYVALAKRADSVLGFDGTITYFTSGR